MPSSSQSPYADDTLSADSWIEISSQPSSSSLSSAADDAHDEARYQHDAHLRRRKRFVHNAPHRMRLPERTNTGTSSQDEYDESESESDRVMTSSNEGLQPCEYSSARESSNSTASLVHGEDGDDEDGVTALGTAIEQSCFTPQPNIFSHPPSSLHRVSEPVPDSYFQLQPLVRQTPHRHSYQGQLQARQSHTPYNIMTPSHHIDHDAALRASLSTLLSCAAAARSLPKNSPASATRAQQGSARVDPSSLRMVPEAIIHARQQQPLVSRCVSSGSTSASSDVIESPSVTDKGKRKAGVRSSSKDRLAAKKARRVAVDEVISPTLLTWVVSAGVIVVVSALSFSAGYTVGHEAGKLEALDAAGLGPGVAAGKNAARGGMSLRRLRWSSAASVAVGA